MQKICKKMQIYANIYICPISSPQLHRYAKICKKYACICKISKHEIYMHNMHLPLCWCSWLDASWYLLILVDTKPKLDWFAPARGWWEMVLTLPGCHWHTTLDFFKCQWQSSTGKLSWQGDKTVCRFPITLQARNAHMLRVIVSSSAISGRA